MKPMACLLFQMCFNTANINHFSVFGILWHFFHYLTGLSSHFFYIFLYLSNLYRFFFFFNSSPFLNIVIEATFGTLPLTVQHMCDLEEAIPLYWSLGTSHPILV